MKFSDPRQVLVVGAGGFIGQHVLAAFSAAGAKVTGLDRAAAPQDLASHDWITGSVLDGSLLASAVSGHDTVVFLANASLPGSSQADMAEEVRAHVEPTIRSAEICCRLGVQRFLFASSGGTVYGFSPAAGSGLREDDPTRPRNAYGVSKLAIEHYLRLIGATSTMSTLSLRISNPYGEGQRAVRGQGVVAAAMQHAMTGDVMPIWGDGTIERDFIHVVDVASAFAVAASHRTSLSALNIGSGKGTSIKALLAMVEAAVGRPVRADYRHGRVVDVHRNVLDVEQAFAQLGWRPQIQLQAGLDRTADWWRRQHSVSAPL